MSLNFDFASSEPMSIPTHADTWMVTAGGELNMLEDFPEPLLVPDSVQQTLLQTMTDGVFIAHDGHFVFANAALTRMLGYAHEEFVGLDFMQVVAPQDQSQWQQRILRAGSPGTSAGGTRLCLRKKDAADEIWVELHVSRLLHDERPCVMGVVRDISQRRRNEQHGRLRDHVMEQLANGAGLESVLHAIVFATEEVIPQMCCAVLLVSPHERRLVRGAMPNVPDLLAAELDGMDMSQGRNPCVLATRASAPLVIPDLTDWPQSSSALLATQAGLHASWSAPVLNSANRVTAVFVAYFNLPRVPSPADTALLQAAVALSGFAIERKRAEEELKLASLVYQTSAEGMMVMDGGGRVLSMNEALTRICGYGADELLSVSACDLPMLRDGQTVVSKINQALSAHGQWQGEVWGQRKNGDAFVCWVTVNSSLDKHGAVQRRVVLFSDITNRKQSEELIWRQTNFDMLTQLPNRNMLQDRLAQEIRKAHHQGTPLALLSLDLDRFKEVNETLGQQQGDLVLIEAARRIRQTVGDFDTVARMGSNEFAVILYAQTSVAEVEQLVARLTQVLAASYGLESGPLNVGVSMGLAWYPEDATDADSVLSHATQALKVAKAQGGNQCCRFTTDRLEATQARARMVRDLRVAVAEQQFVLHFQPIVDVRTGRIHKAEALLRWMHPERGMISPLDFIPLAEETGLIVDIGHWVFREAALWAKRWRAHDADFQVSINKSPAQFDTTGHGAQQWLDCLQELNLAGDAIVIEITEGLLLNSEPHVAATMNAYRKAGIQLAIDDFGTGYSALSYLKKFQIDYLKIDQSFTRNLELGSSDLALCEAIVVMAHRLGLKVVAEGLETAEQRGLLQEMGCDHGQGYLFARPVTPMVLEEMLTASAAGLNTDPAAPRVC